MNSEKKNSLKHLGIIMDGNGRWAQERNLQRAEAYRVSIKNIYNIAENCINLSIEHLTLFTFSSENWDRPKKEVDQLMKIFKYFLKNKSDPLIKNQIRLKIIGCVQDLPQELQDEITKIERATKNFNRIQINLAFNYSSRVEMIKTVQVYTKAVQQGKENPDSLNWDTLSNYMYTRGIPDPDFIIRTSGEKRLSNFLLLQSAYTELYFTPVYWPDFTEKHLQKAIEDFHKRKRRFGKLDN